MPLSDDTVLTQAKARYLLARQFSEPWRKEAKLAYNIVAGHQIDAKDLARLERDKRPAVVFNLIGPNIKAITGMERGNRHEIKYLPREKSQIDGFAAEIYNETISWIFDRNDNQFYESQGFRDMAITGMGWTKTAVEYTDDPKGKITAFPIDPLRKLWDPSARMENLSDRRFDFTEVLLDLEEFEAMGEEFEEFAKANTLVGNAFGELLEDDLEKNPLIQLRPDQYAQEGRDTRGEQFLGKIAVLEYNFYTYEEVFGLLDETGKVVAEFTDKRKGADLTAAGATVSSLGKRAAYYKAWFNGNELIKQQPNTDPRAFTEYCITGEYDHEKGYWFGVVRPMIDPQQWANKLFMQLLHIINSNAKGGFFFKKGAFINKDKALADWARGDRGIEVGGNAGEPMGNLIQERVATPLPTAMHELLLFVTGIIPRVSGFNMELLGLSGKDQPGILENMRKQAGMTILAPFFDSLRFYRRLKGRGMIFFMRNYVGQERMLRIVNDDLKKVLAEIESLPDVDNFDVFVEEAPHSPNLKNTNFVMLGEFLQTQPALATLIGDLVLEQSPLPASVVAEIKKRMEAARKPDPQKEQLALRKMVADIVLEEMAALKDHSAAVLNMAKAGQTQNTSGAEQDALDMAAFKESAKLVSTIHKTTGSPSDGSTGN